jgi:transposase
VTQIICGVDVSSRFLDARIGPSGAAQRFPRTAQGLADLAAFCRANTVTLVALEATGGYEKAPYRALWEAAIPAAVVNPRSVRQFAQAMGYLEKTDAIDAGVIAWFAEVRGIGPQEPPSENQVRLKALVGRIRQLTQMRTSQTLQRTQASDPDILAEIDTLLDVISQKIDAWAREVATLLRNDPLWARLDTDFRAVKGVADRTIALLMAEFPEIGTISGKAAAKLAGLAPIAKDSGNARGRRSIRGGRTAVRAILYIAAGVAARYEPDFIEAQRKLLAAGKPKKVARIALARKLLVRLNAKARDIRRDMQQNA